MKVALGSDHAGFALRSTVIEAVEQTGGQLVDLGAMTLEPGDDYPVFADRVAQAVRSGAAERGIVLCGSGVGASVAANKVRGVRAALCADTFSARQGVEDDDMNVLCLGARVTGPSLASEIVVSFLRAKFSDAERHRRRLEQVKAIEARESTS
ncbi:MAG TPA: ribose 5-phosphate isomerase B [Gemmatimonadaceae bacterium]